jgi:hypothetical protein
MAQIKMPSGRLLLAVACLGWGHMAYAAPESALRPVKSGDVRWAVTGEATPLAGNAGFAPKGTGTVVAELQEPRADHYLITGEMLLEKPGSTVAMSVEKPAGGSGEAVVVKVLARPGKDGRLQIDRQILAVPKVTESWLPFAVSLLHGRARMQVLVPGARAVQADAPGAARRFTLSLKGAQARNLCVCALPSLPATLMPVSLDSAANVQVAGPAADRALGPALDSASLPKGVVEADGVPFCCVGRADANALDVSSSPRRSHIRSRRESKQPYSGLACEVPGDAYSALHLLAFSSTRQGTAPRLAARLGYQGGGADIWVEKVVAVPYLSGGAGNRGEAEEIVSRIPLRLADGTLGHLYHVRVPLAASADLRGLDPLGVELTRDISVPPDSVATQVVDPPSGVVVLAATLERSPLAVQYSTGQPGNIFHETQKAAFTVQLTNRCQRPLSGRVYAACAGPGTVEEGSSGRRNWTVEKPFALPPGKTEQIALDVTPGRRGWYACTLGVEAGGRPVQVRQTTFAVLAPDTRKAVGESPFGVWCFWGSHTATDDPDRVDRLASLIHKGGWRWTYGGKPSTRRNVAELPGPEVYQRLKNQYKITFNCQYPRSAKSAGPYHGAYYEEENFRETVVPWLAIAREKGFDPSYIVLHENRSSKAVVVRYSDFLGGRPYDMPAAEKEKLEGQFEMAKQFCAAVKKADPQAKILLINDYPAFAGEYLRRGFPAELFDVLGSEGAMFSRQPERQPDWLCLLGQIQQWKRMQAAYGYHKPVWFTEALYHGTGPGRLSLHEQAVIAVREAMLALAGGIERMAMCGVLADSADDYTRTDWGVAGYCFRDPECNPKPSYAMFAWLTQVLDQARYAGRLEHPSTALHVLDFVRPDGTHVYPLWVVRGKQKVALQVEGTAADVYDAYGNRLPAVMQGARLLVEATDTPVYVTGTRVGRVLSHSPVEIPQDPGRIIFEFDNPAQLQEVPGTSAALEAAPEMMPRIKGKFRSDFVREDGATALRAELLGDEDGRKLLPRHVEYALAKPIVLENQRPFALTLRVKGNGGWGRLMFELLDARGNVWTSVGSGSCENRGYPYVNFDGWHTVVLPLPGKYPGGAQPEGWPANEEWSLTLSPRWESEQEGSKPKDKLEYPLRLTKIIVTMRPHILYADTELNVRQPVVFLDRLGVLDPPPGM